MFDNLETIYKVFSDLNNKEKIEYLKELKDKKLGYDINFDNLIKVWEKMN